MKILAASLISAALWLGACNSGPTAVEIGKSTPSHDDRAVVVENVPPSAETAPPSHAAGASPHNAPQSGGSVREDAPVEILRPFPGIAVHPQAHTVEVAATVCLTEGWLEQVVCATGTREHEALVSVSAKASEIHQALLMAGFVNGHPGTWSVEGDQLKTHPPTGDPLILSIRYANAAGAEVTEPITRWIRGQPGNRDFPSDSQWVFAGSKFVRMGSGAQGAEHYAADRSGSIVGLVTFGDELIAFADVISDQSSVQAPEWEARTGAIPPIGTPVTLIIHGASK